MAQPANDCAGALPALNRARVAGSFARPAVKAAEEMGADLMRLGDDCGLGDLTKDLPENIPVAGFLALLDAAATQLADPLFGLHVGQSARVMDAAGYGMVMCACKDIRAVVEQTVRFEGLAHDLGRSEIVEIDGVVEYRWHSPWLDLPGGRHMVELQASNIRTLGNWLAGGFILPVAGFSFKHQLPAGTEAEDYERVLMAPMRFGAAFNGGTFPSALLDLPVVNADTSLFPAIVRLAEQRLEVRRRETRDLPFLSVIRECVRQQMNLGRPTLAAVAAALATSERGLQRKLAEADTTFSILLDEIRREVAQEYMADQDLSLTDIAFLLGFGSQSSFNHAFRTWFGVAPTIWRNKQSAHSPARPGSD